MPADQMQVAKEALVDAERLLGMSRERLAQALQVSPRSWRSYVDPSEPGPPPDMLVRLDELLAERGLGEPGHMVRMWTPVEVASAPAQSATVSPPSVTGQRQSRVRTAVLAAAAVVIVIVAVVVVVASRGRDDAARSRRVTIYNKVVLDDTTMKEDVPAYLTVSPQCLAKSTCGVPGTDVLVTGDRVTAVCQVEGTFVTNRFGDVVNEANYDSTLWYGIEMDDKTFGYLSEVWIKVDDRGGLGLRECNPSA